jgi:cell division protein FtsI/penicillin-binding protein 2
MPWNERTIRQRRTLKRQRRQASRRSWWLALGAWLARFSRPAGAVSANRSRQADPGHRRLRILQAFLIVALAVITGRLFELQVMQHGWYSALASDQHSIFAQLFPTRGEIFLSDPKALDGRFPAAVNKTLATVYADTRELTADEVPAAVAALAGPLELDEAAQVALTEKLSVPNDPYIPIRGRLEDRVFEQLRALELPGIGFTHQSFRFYPEKETACHLTGFVGSNAAGEQAGRYGVEGYWNAELAGQQGFLASETDPGGHFITAGSHDFQPAVDGSQVVLTIDRNIQFVACNALREAVDYHQATGGSVIILEPQTGAVLAMCGQPEFDPNAYNEVPDIAAFNNPATYYAYEPGSVFKPLTMAAAIDAGTVNPKTTYIDEGEVKIGKYTIKNSDGKAYGRQTMTEVLAKSLNTGAIFAVEQLGPEPFRKYMEAFGFGRKTGVGVTEVAGDVTSLSRRGDIWSATASYGQGLTATPIQVASAFAVLANGGKLVQPHLVSEVIEANGMIERTETKVVRQVISKRAADLVSGMLVNVVEEGHGTRAAVPGYWVAGKTGTAQVSLGSQDGYAEDMVNVTFVGFAPVDDPAFVLLTKLDRPEGAPYASMTAAPLFGEIAAFLLQYLQIPPDRPVR